MRILLCGFAALMFAGAARAADYLPPPGDQ